MDLLGRVFPGKLAAEVAKLGRAVTPHVLEMCLKTLELDNPRTPGGASRRSASW